ncbi:MAG: substrate-binding domain-containing protein, partial [Anaerolineae bacterium]|nr:substrate-binding domain-containing protein [Anaerolineae bacterium]
MKSISRLSFIVLALIVTMSLTACGGATATTEPTEKPAESPTEKPTEKPTTAPTAEPTEEMLKADLLGAGASFPNPIYLEWIAEYTANVQPGVTINYQSIGSGGGVEQFIGQQTVFGGTDAFLTDEELADATAARSCEP